jgi:spore germination protein YaaH
VASGDSQAISQMIDTPTQNANNLINDVLPLMKKYHFQDLNLDIEDPAMPTQAEQTNFIQFIKTVKQQMDQRKLGTLTIEITPNNLISPNLINTQSVAPYVNNIIIMAYDYHASVSSVTGAVAPLAGAGVDSEYDVTTAVEKALQLAPSEKIILGMPLYGYEWQTLSTAIHSAIIPGTALTASNNRMQSLLSSCSSCSVFFDNESQEEFVVYRDPTTEAFHQFYFPTQQSVASTINLANAKELNGVALWALGYEGLGMLSPLLNYK